MSADLIGVAIVLWAIPIFVAYSQGKAKDRFGLAYGLLLGWLGVIILALLPAATGHGKRCPDCAEMVARDALVCRHCGYRFGAVAAG